MPELYIIIAEKIFFPDFLGEGARASSPVSYAYGFYRATQSARYLL